MPAKPFSAHDLKRAFSQLPPLPESDTPDNWLDKRRELRNRFTEPLIDHELSFFLQWSEIVSTMFVNECEYILREHEKVQNWYAYPHALIEHAIGSPSCLSEHSWTSGNLVHQAYHLMVWEEQVGRRVTEMQSIIEVGGGYGAMAKVVRSAGFTGTYVIYDLPEFSLLQRYYLSGCGIEHVEFRGYMPPYPVPCDLLIGLWSLSEMNEKDQSTFLHRLRANHFLLAANDANWQGWNSREALLALSVQRAASLVPTGSFYLVG